jgi:hypothetical protein
MRRKKVQSNPKETDSGVSVEPDADLDQKIQSILSRIQRLRKRLDNVQTELESIGHDLVQEEASPPETIGPESE